jgi:hypothetical protein
MSTIINIQIFIFLEINIYIYLKNILVAEEMEGMEVEGTEVGVETLVCLEILGLQY